MDVLAVLSWLVIIFFVSAVSLKFIKGLPTYSWWPFVLKSELRAVREAWTDIVLDMESNYQDSLSRHFHESGKVALSYEKQIDALKAELDRTTRGIFELTLKHTRSLYTRSTPQHEKGEGLCIVIQFDDLITDYLKTGLTPQTVDLIAEGVRRKVWGELKWMSVESGEKPQTLC